MYSETAGDILFWVYDSANLQMSYDPSARRLAIVMLMDENPTRTAFYLAVFEPSGLAYYGTYFSSLGAAPLGEGSPSADSALDLYGRYGEYDAEYLCTPAGSSPLSICWK